VLDLKWYHVKRWFNKKGGKEKSCIEKPYLNDEQKQVQLTYTQQMLTLLQLGAYMVYLDEKWFYVYSRQWVLKYLLKADFEEVGANKLRVRKEINHRHPTKTMFIAASSMPNEEHDFDGKIYIKRISKDKTTECTSFNQGFHFNRDINQMLKNGEWRELYPNSDSTFLFGDLRELITEHFELDDNIGDSLAFWYATFGLNGKKRIIGLLDNDCMEGKETIAEHGNTVQ